MPTISRFVQQSPGALSFEVAAYVGGAAVDLARVGLGWRGQVAAEVGRVVIDGLAGYGSERAFNLDERELHGDNGIGDRAKYELAGGLVGGVEGPVGAVAGALIGGVIYDIKSAIESTFKFGDGVYTPVDDARDDLTEEFPSVPDQLIDNLLTKAARIAGQASG